MPNPSLKDLDPSEKELKKITKLLAVKRGTKGYKSMSEDALIPSKSVKKSKKPKINFSEARIEKIRKEFNESKHKFSKSKINEIRINLYEIENQKNLFAPKIKEIERHLLELNENLFKPKKYYDYDDTEYKGIKNVKDLFDLPIDEDYYKPIITNGAFSNSYIQYESKGNKDKNEYLLVNMLIRSGYI